MNCDPGGTPAAGGALQLWVRGVIILNMRFIEEYEGDNKMSGIIKDRTLYKSAPQDERTAREAACYAFLEDVGAEYVRLDHEKADTMEACEEIDECLGVKICKNLFLCNRQKTAFYLLLMPGDKPFRTKDLSAQIESSRLSFSGEEAMQELLGVTPGSVSVLGLMNDKESRVRLLIDRDVLSEEYLGCHPCINTSSLKIKTADLLEKIIPASGHEYTEVEL